MYLFKQTRKNWLYLLKTTGCYPQQAKGQQNSVCSFQETGCVGWWLRQDSGNPPSQVPHGSCLWLVMGRPLWLWLCKTLSKAARRDSGGLGRDNAKLRWLGQPLWLSIRIYTRARTRLMLAPMVVHTILVAKVSYYIFVKGHYCISSSTKNS